MGMFIPLAALTICTANIHGQDWPRYLGPDGNSVSPQKNILRTWPPGGPEVQWSVDVGIGFGGPVVGDGKVYLLDRDDQTGDFLRCFDLTDGKELWKFSYDAPGSVMFPGSRSVPAIDGNRIYTCGPYGDLYCINTGTHEPEWHRNVWTDFGGGQIPRWAITQCPLVYGDLLIVASQAPRAGVVAYNKITGDVVWKTPPLGPVSYVSPVIVKVGDRDHVVMITASSGRGDAQTEGEVAGIDPLTGNILWTYDNWQCHIPVAPAFDAGGGRVLITGGYEAGAAMIKIEMTETGKYKVNELFKTVEFGSHTKPPLLYDGYFYVQYSTNERRDGLVCMSMDGKIMWKTRRSPGFDKGSMILADGLILATDGAGTLYLIRPDPSGFRPVASAELLAASGGDQPAASDKQNWAPIALADGRLLIRNQNRLLCVKVAR